MFRIFKFGSLKNRSTYSFVISCSTFVCQNWVFGKQSRNLARLSIWQMAASTSMHSLEVSLKNAIKQSQWQKFIYTDQFSHNIPKLFEDIITLSLQMFTLTSEMSFARRATFTWISTSNESVGTRFGVRSILICSKHWLMSLWTTLKNMSMHQSMQSAFDFAAAHKRIMCIEWSTVRMRKWENYSEFPKKKGWCWIRYLDDAIQRFVQRWAIRSGSYCVDRNCCKKWSMRTIVRSTSVQLC